MDGLTWSMLVPLVGERVGQTLVPDGLWKIVEPLIPAAAGAPRGRCSPGLSALRHNRWSAGSDPCRALSLPVEAAGEQ